MTTGCSGRRCAPSLNRSGMVPQEVKGDGT